MSKKQMNNEAGFMGLEGMGALLFYLIMLAGAALLVAQLFTGGKLTDAEKALSGLRMNIQQLYTAQGNYTGISETALITAGAVPAGFKTTDTTITSPWNTAVTVAPSDTNAAFKITIADVPVDDCVKFAMYDVNAWSSITIAGAAPADGVDITTVAGATTACPTDKPATFVFTAN